MIVFWGKSREGLILECVNTNPLQVGYNYSSVLYNIQVFWSNIFGSSGKSFGCGDISIESKVRASSSVKLEYYLIRVEGTLCMNLRFNR